ncbi:MAG TPA: hypothetical protein VN644_08645 [Pyrinomonadaceae bacterium]|nr:hypothetical protein [Pyrinomonadaceae bacterium]
MIGFDFIVTVADVMSAAVSCIAVPKPCPAANMMTGPEKVPRLPLNVVSPASPQFRSRNDRVVT